MSVCRECSRPVIWAKSVNDVAIPLDKEPSIVGNIRLLAGIAHKVPPSGLPIEDDDAWTCHLDTCTKKRTLAAVTDARPRCGSCGLVMDPLCDPGQTTHPCC